MAERSWSGITSGSPNNSVRDSGMPSNSFKSKEAKKQEQNTQGSKHHIPHVTPVIKRSEGKLHEGRIKNSILSFVREDFPDIVDFAIHDVMVPAIKNTIYDMVNGGMARAFWGTRTMPRHTYDNRPTYSNGGYTSYSDRYRSQTEQSNVSRDTIYNWKPPTFTSRSAALRVLSELKRGAEETSSHIITLGDLYRAMGHTRNFLHDEWGWSWRTLASIPAPKPYRSEWILEFPRPRPVEILEDELDDDYHEGNLPW